MSTRIFTFKLNFICLYTLLCLLPASLCGAQEYAEAIREARETKVETSLQVETVAAMNVERAKAGLSLLAINPKLIVLAEEILRDRVARNDGAWLPKPTHGLVERLASQVMPGSQIMVGGISLRVARHPSDLIEGMLKGDGDSPDKGLISGREFLAVGVARARNIRLRDTDWEFWVTVYSSESPERGCLTPIAIPTEQTEPSNLIFPVLNGARWTDTFGKIIVGMKHAGQDLIAPKMTPLVACFDGVVSLKISSSDAEMGGNSVSLKGDSGWLAVYAHVNSDNPGTKDGKGSVKYAFAPGLKSGDHVRAGQLLGYLGESGNARKSTPHCHFELIRKGNPINSASVLRRASILKQPLSALSSAENESLTVGLTRNGQTRFDGIVLSSSLGKITIQLAWKTPQISPTIAVHPTQLMTISIPPGTPTLPRLYPGTRIIAIGIEANFLLKPSLLAFRK